MALPTITERTTVIATIRTGCVAALTACAGSPAHAQSAQQPALLPEVSVSATRIERENRDLPVSIDTVKNNSQLLWITLWVTTPDERGLGVSAGLRLDCSIFHQ